MRVHQRFCLLIGLLAAVLARLALAKEYVVVGSYGNKLHLVDPIALRVTRTYQIPGPGTGPTEMVPSPDGRVMYALTNRWQSVSGIDLESGEEVFRADLNVGDVRVHALFGLEVSPDGKQLFVVEQRYRAWSDHFEVLAPVIAVYRTNGGRAAVPDKLIPTPRQIQHLAVATDGRTLYAHGIDLYAIDIATGAVRQTYPVANWVRTGYGPADSIGWLGEQLNSSRVYAIPFYAQRRDTASAATAQSTRDVGLLTADLKSGVVSLDFFGSESDADGLISASVNPTDRNQAIAIGGEQLFKIDRRTRHIVARAPTSGILFYVDAISSDGQRVYTGGGNCRVGIYRTRDLGELGLVELPDCAVMAQSSLRLVNRP